MARENNQKVKLLCLLEILRQDTDEQHPMSTSTICERLGAMNVPCERRTLAKDIKVLNDMGFEIMVASIGHQKAYYVEDRNFSVPELKIMIDAVQAANFIPEHKTKALIDRIAALGGSHRGELLKDSVICFNTHKHTNETVYYSVGFLETAIREKKKVSFFYFDLDERKEKVFRRDKERYIVEPMALVFNEDNYYLMCFSARYDGICNYRVDRMEKVEIEDEAVSEAATIKSSSVSEYTEQVFKMYGGPAEDCVLQFQPSLIGIIYDKFGESTPIVRLDENACVATVRVQISPTFWGWLFQFAGEMKIVSPESLVQEYKDRATLIIE